MNKKSHNGTQGFQHVMICMSIRTHMIKEWGKKTSLLTYLIFNTYSEIFRKKVKSEFSITKIVPTNFFRWYYYEYDRLIGK